MQKLHFGYLKLLLPMWGKLARKKKIRKSLLSVSELRQLQPQGSALEKKLENAWKMLCSLLSADTSMCTLQNNSNPYSFVSKSRKGK